MTRKVSWLSGVWLRLLSGFTLGLAFDFSERAFDWLFEPEELSTESGS